MQPAQLTERFGGATADEIGVARQWFNDYDGPKAAGCEATTGCFSARIGFNVPSGDGSRGVTVAVESYRESDTILGIYLIATGQT